MNAAEVAAAEAQGWADLARLWRPARHPGVFDDLVAAEAAVVRFHDPSDDLTRRMKRWGYRPGALDLSDLARFAAGLAQAEADGWADDEPHLATRAYEDRRFLLGDRLLHWAIPWLDSVSRCHADAASDATRSAEWMLGVADRMRPAPVLVADEGRFQPGHDAIGPVQAGHDLDEFVLSIWSGEVLFAAGMQSMTGAVVRRREAVRDLLADPAFRRELHALFDYAASRWTDRADRHPGSAEIWHALARRAASTAVAIG